MSSFSDGRTEHELAVQREIDRQAKIDSLARSAIDSINRRTDGLLGAAISEDPDPHHLGREIKITLNKTGYNFALLRVTEESMGIFIGGSHQFEGSSIEDMLRSLGREYQKYFGSS